MHLYSLKSFDLNPKWARTLSLRILHLPHSSLAHWPSHQLGITTLSFGIIHCTKSLPWSMIPREIVITHRIFIGRRYNNFSFFYEKWVKDIPDWDDLLLGDDICKFYQTDKWICLHTIVLPLLHIFTEFPYFYHLQIPWCDASDNKRIVWRLNISKAKMFSSLKSWSITVVS